ncbi:hypothetical protein ACLKA6_014232 [Drosophila palustris]
MMPAHSGTFWPLFSARMEEARQHWKLLPLLLLLKCSKCCCSCCCTKNVNILIPRKVECIQIPSETDVVDVEVIADVDVDVTVNMDVDVNVNVYSPSPEEMRLSISCVIQLQPSCS